MAMVSNAEFLLEGAAIEIDNEIADLTPVHREKIDGRFQPTLENLEQQMTLVCLRTARARLA